MGVYYASSSLLFALLLWRVNGIASVHLKSYNEVQDAVVAGLPVHFFVDYSKCKLDGGSSSVNKAGAGKINSFTLDKEGIRYQSSKPLFSYKLKDGGYIFDHTSTFISRNGSVTVKTTNVPAPDPNAGPPFFQELFDCKLGEGISYFTTEAGVRAVDYSYTDMFNRAKKGETVRLVWNETACKHSHGNAIRGVEIDTFESMGDPTTGHAASVWSSTELRAFDPSQVKWIKGEALEGEAIANYFFEKSASAGTQNAEAHDIPAFPDIASVPHNVASPGIPHFPKTPKITGATDSSDKMDVPAKVEIKDVPSKKSAHSDVPPPPPPPTKDKPQQTPDPPVSAPKAPKIVETKPYDGENLLWIQQEIKAKFTAEGVVVLEMTYLDPERLNPISDPKTFSCSLRDSSAALTAPIGASDESDQMLRFRSYVVGHFNNYRQVAEESRLAESRYSDSNSESRYQDSRYGGEARYEPRASARGRHPLAERLSDVATQKIANLPPGFGSDGSFFLLDESYYSSQGRPVAANPMLFLFSPDMWGSVTITAYDIPGNVPIESLKNSNRALRFDFSRLQVSKSFSKATFTYDRNSRSFFAGPAYTRVDPSTVFVLTETIGEMHLSIMEDVLINGTSIMPWRTPIQYDRV